jgi:hypothetical protein
MYLYTDIVSHIRKLVSVLGTGYEIFIHMYLGLGGCIEREIIGLYLELRLPRSLWKS